MGTSSVDLCQATEAAVTWLENRPCDLVAIAGQGAAVVEGVARVRQVSKTIPVLVVVPDPSAREAGAAWLSGADDVITASALVAGTLPEGLDEVRHPERDVLRRTQRLWYAGPSDTLRQHLVTRLGARFREVGLSAEGLAGLTTQDIEAPHSAALIVNALVEPEALVLGVRRVKRTYPGLAVTVVADGVHHDAFRRAGADECVGLPADVDPVLHAVGRAQATCRAALELDMVRGRESRLRALLEHLPEAVMLVSPEHAVLAVNLAALRLIGAQDARQVIGTPLSPWFEADEDNPDSAVALVDGVAEGATRELFTRTRHLADPRRLQLRAVPFQRETGGMPAALIVLREVVDAPAVVAAPAFSAIADAAVPADERRAWEDERAALSARVDTLLSELTEARTIEALREAQESLADATMPDEERRAWEDERATLNARVDALIGELAEARALDATLREAQAALEAAQQAQEALRDAADEARAERDQAAGALVDAQHRVAELEASLSDAWAQKAGLERDVLQARTAAAASDRPVDVPSEHAWLVQEIAHVGFVRTTLDGRILEANDHAARLCGYRSAPAMVDAGTLPLPLTMLAEGEDAGATRFEVCLQIADGASPRWIAGARLPMSEHDVDRTWLLAETPGHRAEGTPESSRPDTLNAVLEVVAEECASIVEGTPNAVRGPRPIDAAAVSPVAAQALDRARVLLAQVSSFRRRREGQAALDELRTHLTALDPVLERLATDDVAWELSLPDEAIHVTASASDIERCVTALVAGGRDALPLGGRLSLTVETPSPAGAPIGYSKRNSVLPFEKNAPPAIKPTLSLLKGPLF